MEPVTLKCKIINVKGFDVIYDPIFADEEKICMAALVKDRGIFITDSFLKLSENAQYFVLLHELGHQEHDHINKSTLFDFDLVYAIATIIGIIPRQEMEADDFAAFEIGYEAAASAMEETIVVLSEEYPELSLQDLRLRLRRLKNQL